jgi:hypothetical protein
MRCKESIPRLQYILFCDHAPPLVPLAPLPTLVESLCVADSARFSSHHRAYPWITIFGPAVATNKARNDPRNRQPESKNGTSPACPTEKSTTHLLHILISESVHLIWVLQSERVIREAMHSKEEIISRWPRSIHARLTKAKTEYPQPR